MEGGLRSLFGGNVTYVVDNNGGNYKWVEEVTRVCKTLVVWKYDSYFFYLRFILLFIQEDGKRKEGSVKLVGKRKRESTGMCLLKKR